ncbi:MAG: copper resistance protein CopC [Brachybacterium sp.]|nr:copper resistance protein CopC [Brachybacterium sp.]
MTVALPSPPFRPTVPVLSAARRALTIVLGGLAALLLIAVPGTALAHDHLVSTDPPEGGSVETSPEEIVLTYSAEILDVSPLVRITGEDGEVYFDGEPQLSGTDATVALDEPLPAGETTVQWRVVSSDGHPIEGEFAFTVENDTPGAEETTPATEDEPEESPTEDEAAATGTEENPEDHPGAAEDPTGEAASDDSSPLMTIVAIGGALALIAIGVLLFTGRRGRETEATDAPQRDDAPGEPLHTSDGDTPADGHPRTEGEDPPHSPGTGDRAH